MLCVYLCGWGVDLGRGEGCVSVRVRVDLGRGEGGVCVGEG